MVGYDDHELLHGRYRLEEAIGQGGFGTTWRAHDTTLDMPVCIKEYFDTRSDIIQSVYGEARSLADFHDEPGIVQVLDAFMEDGRAYLVMELLGGEDLSAYVSERGALSLDDTLSLLRPVFRALERVHEAGVVHRDVSPRQHPRGQGQGEPHGSLDQAHGLWRGGPAGGGWPRIPDAVIPHHCADQAGKGCLPIRRGNRETPPRSCRHG